jgi:hypothetical protein
MGWEDFNRFIEDWEEKEKHYQVLYDAYSQNLPTALAEEVFVFFPKLKQKPDTQKAVVSIGEKYVGEIWEVYNNCSWLNTQGGAMAELNPARKPTTRKQAEQQRLNEIKGLPKKYHARYSKLFWKSYNENFITELFEYAIYEKMKKVFNQYYIDDIMEFESPILRYMDRCIYLTCMHEYVDEIYGLE